MNKEWLAEDIYHHHYAGKPGMGEITGYIRYGIISLACIL